MSKTPKSARKPALQSPPTTAEIAVALAVSSRRVSQLKIDGMPVHTIEAALQWRKAQSSIDSVERLRLERIRLVVVQRERVEIENASRRNELMPRDEVRTNETRIGAAVGAALQVLENELPQLLLGLSLDRARPICKERTRIIQAMLADEYSEFWKAHPAGDSRPN